MTSRQPLRSSVAFLALAAHNAEEALFARDWALANVDLLKRYATMDLAAIWAGPAFRLSLLCLTLALLALSVLAARASRRSVAVYALLAVLAVFASNALFPHIAAAVALQAYVPGVATAIALVLPAATWIYLSTLREGYATAHGLLIAAIIGVVFYAAVASVVVSF
ncbi:MAG: HXXEE domain-containing protein [Betaproteobacteria bacterium]|nr:HXXEE domain-containing protein [Betaproteobacteria bacterium]